MSPIGTGAQVPQLVTDDVALLFKDLSAPENSVVFDPPSRANPATIQSNIDPPAATWTCRTSLAALSRS